MATQSLRDIIEIKDELCDGCGLCIPNCAEGALAIVDGKVRIVDDARCDGAGACIGHCPTGALRVIKRDAAAFDEKYAHPEPQPPKPSFTPLDVPLARPHPAPSRSHVHGTGGCPGAASMTWKPRASQDTEHAAAQPSSLEQWPVQLHLLNPAAPFWDGKPMLVAADCVPFAMGSFHSELLAGASVAIACPKLDDPSGYLEKLTSILKMHDIPSLRIAIMEVPCCRGLMQLAVQAARNAMYQGEIEVVIVSRQGKIIQRQSIQQAA